MSTQDLQVVGTQGTCRMYGAQIQALKKAATEGFDARQVSLFGRAVGGTVYIGIVG